MLLRWDGIVWACVNDDYLRTRSMRSLASLGLFLKSTKIVEHWSPSL